ncbi:MAG: NAD-dependent epimerase/dehydratase family protein [Sedimentisphaerales bacterium]|nr:NAD-dependent epimerase/dehydratase family protein [Sedimentisphaerales bacterium]
MIDQEILRQFNGRRALVTGGTGLIGRQVVKMLCDAGAEVSIVSLDRVRVSDRAEHIFGDLTNFEFCKDVTYGMDCVCHLAGIKGSAAVSTSMVASHFVPTLMMNTNVLEACLVNDIPKVVYTSSIGAYASTDIFREADYRLDSLPMDFAGWAKRVAELQIQAYHTQYGRRSFAIVRPSNVYGPGDNFDPQNAMVIPSLMYRIRRGEDPLRVWGDGSAVRDFVFSRDVAEGVLLALHHGTEGGFVNLGSGRECTIRQLVETLNQFLDFRYEFDASKPSGYPKRLMDIERARELIGYDPSTSLLDGLQETWAWYLEHEGEHECKKNYFAEAVK